METLRNTYGPVTKQGAGRIRTNQELRELHRTPDLAVDIKRRRLERLRHGIPMDQTRLKKMYARKGRREVGRPRLNWLEDAEDDLTL
jgi:hypothetical protein